MKKLYLPVFMSFISLGVNAEVVEFQPKIDWKDQSGNLINAHGGHVIEYNRKYYWIGQDRTHNNNTFNAINCYSSDNLVDWDFENAVMTPEKNEELPSSVIIARPKFIYNELTNSFVMWFKYRDPQGVSPNMKSGVSSSTTPCGDYIVEDIFYPETGSDKHYAGDNAILLDDDGTAYYVLSSVGEVGLTGEGSVVGGENLRRLKIFKLSSDFRDVEELLYEFPIESDKKQRREGPALTKFNDKYILLSSGTSGWGKNQQKYSTADSMSGPWSEWKDIGNLDGYGSQTAYIIPVQGDNKTTLIYGGDDHNSENLKDSRYVWLPIKVSENSFSLDYMNIWKLDTLSSEWRPTLDATLSTNELTGTAHLSACSTALKGKTINKLGTGGDNNGAVTFENLYAEAAGEHTITMSYISETERDADIYINGTLLGTYAFPSSGNWCYNNGSPATIEINADLSFGNNNIQIKNDNGNAPNIDFIELSF